MRGLRRLSFLLFVAATFWVAALQAPAQQLTIGIAPTFDAGSDESGPAISQHLVLFLYRDLARGNSFIPVLLNPGGVYSPFDTSWLVNYVHDRPELDLLLVTTLKPNAKDGGLVVDVSLLDARTGAKLSSWTATSVTDGKKGWMKGLPANLKSQGGLNSESSFEKGPFANASWRVADSIRDVLPAKTAEFPRTTAPMQAPPNVTSPPSQCVTHTRITYGYKHSVSRSHLLLVNDLEQTSTLKDGFSSFTLPEGPTIIQFSLNDAPYTMSKQAFYQLSTIHSCSASTLIIDLGAQGDEHHHWE
jgi:hypothetical protein